MERDNKVLIIEDDKHIHDFMAVSLRQSEYKVISAYSASEGLFMFSSHKPDLILLDLGLGDRDGIEIITEIRDISEVPIIVVSARGMEKEKIEALDLGANDYVTKPFHMGELLARIRVALRSIESLSSGEQDHVFSLDYLLIDQEKRKVCVDNMEIHLTPIEYKLLILLVTNRGKVLTHNYIVKKIWGYEDQTVSRSLRVYMANLRRKLEKDTAKPRFILTEVGVGYKFADE